MLTALNKVQRKKQNYKLVEKSADLVFSIINEINMLEKELKCTLDDDFKRSDFIKTEAYSDELLELFKVHIKNIIRLSDSVYIPFSISEAIKHPYIDPLESLANVNSECERWLNINNVELEEVVK